MAADERFRADGVFEGGGVKGIAFAGAIAAAEQDAGVRAWVNVAGTPAGAIVAVLLAAGYDAAGAGAGPLRRGVAGRAARRVAARAGARQDGADVRLHAIASDVTGGRMVVLPDDLPQYEDEQGAPLRKDSFPVVRAIRMSMSYPFLFTPVECREGGGPLRSLGVQDLAP